MNVILGGNSFVDCQTLLAYQGSPVLRVLLSPVRVTLSTPSGVPNVSHLVVDEGMVAPAEAGLIVAGDGLFTLISHPDRIPILMAVLANSDTVCLRIELRPLGMNIYDDVNGLHIGGNVFRGNDIRNAAIAINLG